MKLIDLFEQDEEQFTPPMKQEAEISAEILPFLQHEIEKLNKRARKLNVPEIHLEQVGEPTYKDYKDANDEVHKRKYLTIRVHGETPKLADWQFVGTINHKGDESILNVVPGQDGTQLKKFHNAKAEVCDHCKKSRRRIDTYIVKNVKTNELKQVGSNCLKDFLGGKDPKNVLWYMSLFSTIEQLLQRAENKSNEGGGSYSPHIDTESAIVLGLELISKYGFRSSQAGGWPTSGQLRHGFFGRLHQHSTKEEIDVLNMARAIYQGHINPTFKAQASEIIEWAKNLPEADTDREPFLHNIKVIAKSPYVSSREMGYLAGMIVAAQRAQGQEQARKQRTEKSNVHLGQVGEKISAKVKVVGTTTLPNRFSRYGPDTRIVRMEDPQGNMIVWFSNTGQNFHKDEEFEIVGTVKKHDEYQGRKQTVITRAQIKK